MTNWRNKEKQECSDFFSTALPSFISSQCELRSKWQPEKEVRPDQDCASMYVVVSPREKPREAMLCTASHNAPIRAL